MFFDFSHPFTLLALVIAMAMTAQVSAKYCDTQLSPHSCASGEICCATERLGEIGQVEVV